ncbi:hypothetical protein AB0J21_29770 [Streptomyces sp. NPDC049954]|uniref:hypothetical protein n=1 Tax=Streptomyces sp. NPDC049954 TaxID=3155779 RepID=UPI0034262BDB
MGSLRITLCAGAVVAAAALAPATAAHAGEGHHPGKGRPGEVSLTPSTVAPGGSVEIRVDGCDGTTGAASSAAFVSEVALNGKDGRENPLYGEATVDHNTAPGTYRVSVDCDGYRGPKGAFQVLGGSRPTPTAPIHAGGGATARIAAKEAAPTGPSTSQTVFGGVLAGAAGVIIAGRVMRRRRRPQD